jgi:hypothetical protein
MNITIAIVFVRGTAKIRIEGECLVKCAVEGTDGGADIDANRRILEQAFIEMYGTGEIDVLFPELGECIDDSN